MRAGSGGKSIQEASRGQRKRELSEGWTDFKQSCAELDQRLSSLECRYSRCLLEDAALSVASVTDADFKRPSPESKPVAAMETENPGSLPLIRKATMDEKRTRRFSVREMNGMQEALDAVDHEAERFHEKEGLSRVSFFLGVLNLPVLCLVFAWFPGWFWVLYAVEFLFLFPCWLYTVHHVYRGMLFVLDFCWITNVFFCLYMLSLALQSKMDFYSDELRRWAFIIFFSIALGPLSWACVLLHNGWVFHNIEKIASLFIHMVPLFVAWTIVHYNNKVQEYWPGCFPSSEELQEVSFLELYIAGVIPYMIWLVLHGAWLLTVGVDLPAKGWDTVFGNLYQKQKLGPKWEKRFGCKSVRSHAAIYLLFHCLACLLAFTWPLLCFWSRSAHTIFAFLVFANSCWEGAGYYEYAMAKRYSHVLRKVMTEKELMRASSGSTASLG